MPTVPFLTPMPTLLVRPSRLLLATSMMLVAGCNLRQPALTPAPVVAPPPATPPAATATATATAATSPTPKTSSVPVRPAAPSTPDDVVKTALSVFGDSAVIAVADSMNPAEPVWDMDVRSYETHERVEHYVDLFANSARDRFQARLARGTRYDAMIRAKMRANGMPEDLTYLALIESGYDPNAYSRAAAVGMWQFMSSTARDIGMRVDWWVDDRRDPARSTDGAIRFLSFLQKQFGSLYLAAAAYNGGPGRVARGLTRFAEELEGLPSEDRFFALADQDYLRAETKNYVPQMIAAALVAKMPAKYGIQFDSLPPYAYDSVDVAPGTSLGAVAIASGSTATEIKELNPALLRGVAPPDTRTWVRVPTGRAERAVAALDTLGTVAVRGWTMAEVDDATLTPAAFAAKRGITLKQLRWFNPTLKTTRKGRLASGQLLRIPRPDVLTFARELPDPSIERYGTSTGSSLASRGVHVVKRGETLGAIARRYGLSESRLKSLNGMRGTRVLAGQTLVVRGTVKTAAANATGKSTASTSSAKKRSTSKATTTTSTAKKPTAKKSTAKKSTAKKSTAKKSTAKKSTAKKSTAKKPTTTKSTKKKAPASSSKKVAATKKR